MKKAAERGKRMTAFRLDSEDARLLDALVEHLTPSFSSLGVQPNASAVVRKLIRDAAKAAGISKAKAPK